MADHPYTILYCTVFLCAFTPRSAFAIHPVILAHTTPSLLVRVLATTVPEQLRSTPSSSALTQACKLESSRGRHPHDIIALYPIAYLAFHRPDSPTPDSLFTFILPASRSQSTLHPSLRPSSGAPDSRSRHSVTLLTRPPWSHQSHPKWLCNPSSFQTITTTRWEPLTMRALL